MLDSVFIGMSGLQTYSAGLKVIGNNVANLNTAGFKSTSLAFTDLFYQDQYTSTPFSQGGNHQFGTGVTSGNTVTNFKAGDTLQTGNATDLAIAGDGFFVLRDPATQALSYTRAGQFEFNAEGVLVKQSNGHQVMGLTNGALGEISLSGLRINPPKPTSAITFTGNLSSTATEFNLDAVKVIDSAGAEHTLKLNFKPKANATATWTVTLSENSVEVGTGELMFVGGTPLAGSDKFSITYTGSGASAQSLSFDFSSGVTSFSTGTTSTLAVAKADGHTVGTISKLEFGADGLLTINYSNGEKVTSAHLALARFESTAGLEAKAGGEFVATVPNQVRYAKAKESGLGSISPGQVEGSNVDISAEFSQLIVAQRGYQASSRIVSTASEMLQDLFSLKSGR